MPQSCRFIETARELGCDEDKAAFEENLRKVANARKVKRKNADPDVSS